MCKMTDIEKIIFAVIRGYVIRRWFNSKGEIKYEYFKMVISVELHTVGGCYYISINKPNS